MHEVEQGKLNSLHFTEYIFMYNFNSLINIMLVNISAYPCVELLFTFKQILMKALTNYSHRPFFQIHGQTNKTEQRNRVHWTYPSIKNNRNRLLKISDVEIFQTQEPRIIMFNSCLVQRNKGQGWKLTNS